MLSQGWGNATAAAAASAALGGGHAVSVWSAGPTVGAGEASTSAASAGAGGGAEGPEGDEEGEGEGGEEEAKARLTSGDWSDISTALGTTAEYDELSLETRCALLECLCHLLMETALSARFFEASNHHPKPLTHTLTLHPHPHPHPGSLLRGVGPRGREAAGPQACRVQEPQRHHRGGGAGQAGHQVQHQSSVTPLARPY